MRGYVFLAFLVCMLFNGYKAAEVAAPAAKPLSAEQKQDATKAISAAIEQSLTSEKDENKEEDDFELDQEAINAISERLVNEADENDEEEYDLEDADQVKDAKAKKAHFWGRRRRRWRIRVRRVIRTGTKVYCCMKKLFWCCGKK